jgi:hypothetical protein
VKCVRNERSQHSFLILNEVTDRGDVLTGNTRPNIALQQTARPVPFFNGTKWPAIDHIVQSQWRPWLLPSLMFG